MIQELPVAESVIREELRLIMRSDTFENSPVMRRFLKFIVIEALEGRSERVKSTTIAEAVFRRDPADAAGDGVVRTAAGRLRSALKTYYENEGAEADLIISLPKGRYVPVFIPREGLLAGDDAQDDEAEPPRKRRYAWPALALSVAAIGFFLLRLGPSWSVESPGLTIVVHSTDSSGPSGEAVASRLHDMIMSTLGQIDLAKIVAPAPDGAIASSTGFLGSFIPTEQVVLNLYTKVNRANSGKGDELYWRLVDPRRDTLMWSAREPLPESSAEDLDQVANLLAFKILGENGAVPVLMMRNHSEMVLRPICLHRSLVGWDVDENTFAERRKCLEERVAATPSDANAWAALSSLYTHRTDGLFSDAGQQLDEQTRLARVAADRAVQLHPYAYLPRVARMHVAWREGKIAAFDAQQKRLRQDYPGDMYLKLRIASRLAWLGRGAEALALFEEVERSGVEIGSRNADIALAYFLEGDYQKARERVELVISDKVYKTAVEGAILGKLGELESAAPVIEELRTLTADVGAELRRILAIRNCVPQVLAQIAAGLAAAGLELDRP